MLEYSLWVKNLCYAFTNSWLESYIHGMRSGRLLRVKYLSMGTKFPISWTEIKACKWFHLWHFSEAWNPIPFYWKHAISLILQTIIDMFPILIDFHFRINLALAAILMVSSDNIRKILLFIKITLCMPHSKSKKKSSSKFINWCIKFIQLIR